MVVFTRSSELPQSNRKHETTDVAQSIICLQWWSTPPVPFPAYRDGQRLRSTTRKYNSSFQTLRPLVEGTFLLDQK